MTDLEQHIALLTEQARVMRLTIDLRRANVYRDLADLEAQKAAADAARALQEDPIISATGRIVGWLGKTVGGVGLNGQPPCDAQYPVCKQPKLV